MTDITKAGDFIVKNIRPEYASEKEREQAEQAAIKAIDLACRRIRQEEGADQDAR